MIEEDDKGRVIKMIWVKGCVYHIIDFYWGLTEVSGDIIIFQEKGFHVEEGDCGVFSGYWYTADPLHDNKIFTDKRKYQQVLVPQGNKGQLNIISCLIYIVDVSIMALVLPLKTL